MKTGSRLSVDKDVVPPQRVGNTIAYFHGFELVPLQCGKMGEYYAEIEC
ncbi:MAG: hypothetical protein PUE13_06700 [Clostridiales bacterium]|nr:hypothetical protein [Clostridiales bacterium]